MSMEYEAHQPCKTRAQNTHSDGSGHESVCKRRPRLHREGGLEGTRAPHPLQGWSRGSRACAGRAARDLWTNVSQRTPLPAVRTTPLASHTHRRRSRPCPLDLLSKRSSCRHAAPPYVLSNIQLHVAVSRRLSATDLDQPEALPVLHMKLYETTTGGAKGARPNQSTPPLSMRHREDPKPLRQQASDSLGRAIIFAFATALE